MPPLPPDARPPLRSAVTSPNEHSAAWLYKSQLSKGSGSIFQPKALRWPLPGQPKRSALREQSTITARKVFLSGQERKQKSHSNFGGLKQKAGVKAQQRAWVVFVSVSSICGQTAAVCGRKSCAGLFPPRLELGMLLPQRLPARPCGEPGCAQPLAEGSRGQEEGRNGVRRRYAAWA